MRGWRGKAVAEGEAMTDKVDGRLEEGGDWRSQATEIAASGGFWKSTGQPNGSVGGSR